jgi:peptide/nickel transport system substrate-binding protein
MSAFPSGIRYSYSGTGPFRFESYDPRQKTVLAGNPKYFRGAPVLKQVVVRYIPAVNSRELGLQTGELQIIEGLKEDKWVDRRKLWL